MKKETPNPKLINGNSKNEDVENENESESGEAEEKRLKEENEDENLVEEDDQEEKELEQQKKLEEKRRKFEEETKKKMLVKSEFDSKINKNKVEKVKAELGYFSRCANVEDLNTDIFCQNYSKKVGLGGEDEFGRLGQERLGSNKGKDYRKEKGKLKNREFQGSKITLQNNLIDLD